MKIKILTTYGDYSVEIDNKNADKSVVMDRVRRVMSDNSTFVFIENFVFRKSDIINMELRK